MDKTTCLSSLRFQVILSLLLRSNTEYVSLIFYLTIQLGPYGFLASPEVKDKGALNAGILDQHYALQWVQTHIHQFGGNASHVTIWGQSAGGGSVLLQAMANGGTENCDLFQGLIASSPSLLMQWGFDDYPTTVFPSRRH